MRGGVTVLSAVSVDFRFVGGPATSAGSRGTIDEGPADNIDETTVTRNLMKRRGFAVKQHPRSHKFSLVRAVGPRRGARARRRGNGELLKLTRIRIQVQPSSRFDSASKGIAKLRQLQVDRD